MRYVIKNGNQYVSYVYWVALYIPNLRYTDELNEAMVFKKEYLDMFEKDVGKTKLELIKEKYPEAEIKAVNIVLNSIR